MVNNVEEANIDFIIKVKQCGILLWGQAQVGSHYFLLL